MPGARSRSTEISFVEIASTFEADAFDTQEAVKANQLFRLGQLSIPDYLARVQEFNGAPLDKKELTAVRRACKNYLETLGIAEPASTTQSEEEEAPTEEEEEEDTSTEEEEEELPSMEKIFAEGRTSKRVKWGVTEL